MWDLKECISMLLRKVVYERYRYYFLRQSCTIHVTKDVFYSSCFITSCVHFFDPIVTGLCICPIMDLQNFKEENLAQQHSCASMHASFIIQYTNLFCQSGKWCDVLVLVLLVNTLWDRHTFVRTT